MGVRLTPVLTRCAVATCTVPTRCTHLLRTLTRIRRYFEEMPLALPLLSCGATSFLWRSAGGHPTFHTSCLCTTGGGRTDQPPTCLVRGAGRSGRPGRPGRAGKAGRARKARKAWKSLEKPGGAGWAGRTAFGRARNRPPLIPGVRARPVSPLIRNPASADHSVEVCRPDFVWTFTDLSDFELFHNVHI